MFQFINQRAGLTDRQILWLIQIEPFPNKLQWIQTLVSGNGENGSYLIPGRPAAFLPDLLGIWIDLDV